MPGRSVDRSRQIPVEVPGIAARCVGDDFDVAGSASEEAHITRYRSFLFYKPEGFDTLVKFLDVLTGRDRPN